MRGDCVVAVLEPADVDRSQGLVGLVDGVFQRRRARTKKTWSSSMNARISRISLFHEHNAIRHKLPDCRYSHLDGAGVDCDRANSCW